MGSRRAREAEVTNGGRGLVRKDLVAAEYGGASNLMFNELIKQWMKEGRKVYHFAFGQSPFPIPDFAVEALRHHAADNAYLQVQGLPELREGICRFHSDYDDVTSSPSQVIVGPGSKELIFLLMNVFSGSVLVLSPSWTTYRPQALLAGHCPVLLITDLSTQWKITPAIVEETLATNQITGPSLLIMCNPCNPTGTTYTEEELIALSAVFRKHKIIVLSDEIYARLTYKQNHFSLARVYSEGTIISSGLSKWASAGGWRLGYHIYPSDLSSLMAVVKSAASHTYSCAPAPVQRAAVEIFNNKEASREYILHTSRIMGSVADFCYKELQACGVRMVKPGAGYYVFPDFEVLRAALSACGVTTCQQMCELMLDKCNVAVMAGGPSHLRPVTELTTRLCYVNFDGTRALEASRHIGLDTPLTPAFVKEHCRPVYDGIMALKSWIKDLLNETTAS